MDLLIRAVVLIPIWVFLAYGIAVGISDLRDRKRSLGPWSRKDHNYVNRSK